VVARLNHGFVGTNVDYAQIFNQVADDVLKKIGTAVQIIDSVPWTIEEAIAHNNVLNQL